MVSRQPPAAPPVPDTVRCRIGAGTPLHVLQPLHRLRRLAEDDFRIGYSPHRRIVVVVEHCVKSAFRRGFLDFLSPRLRQEMHGDRYFTSHNPILPSVKKTTLIVPQAPAILHSLTAPQKKTTPRLTGHRPLGRLVLAIYCLHHLPYCRWCNDRCSPPAKTSAFHYFAVALSTRNCPTFSWKKYSSKLFSFA